MRYLEQISAWWSERKIRDQGRNQELKEKELARITSNYCSSLMDLSSDRSDPFYSRRQNSFHSDIVQFINFNGDLKGRMEEDKHYTRWVCATTIAQMLSLFPKIDDQAVISSLSVSACRLLRFAVDKTEKGEVLIIDRDWLSDFRKGILAGTVDKSDIDRFINNPPTVPKQY